MTPTLGKLFQVLRVFSTPSDWIRYYAILGDPVSRGKHPVPIKVRALGGIPVFCRPGTSDAHVLWDTFHGLYHLPPVSLAEHSTILDLGCNVGYTMVHFASLYPTARILGFEMDEENCQMAERNTRPFAARCKVVHAAVWKSAGEISYEGADPSAFRVVVGGAPDRKRVAAKTLGGIFEEFGLAHVDYLKMDIEGAESDVLGGGGSWTERVSSMKIEVHEQGDMERIRKILESKGFVCRADDRHWSCCVAVNVERGPGTEGPGSAR